MPHTRFSRVISTAAMTAVIVGSLLLAACGTSTNAATDIKNIVIATDLPVSGTDAGVALPTEHGADLAISQASLPKGYTVSVLNENDEGATGPDATIGKANIEKLVQNGNVVAVIGPFNSGVAEAEIPVINASCLVEISPTNTNPGLTIAADASANGIIFSDLHPAGKPEAYFRVCGNDVDQGKVDAEVATSPQVGAKKVFVVDDSSTYGKGLANYFTAAYTAIGSGTIVGTAEISPATIGSIPSLVTTILSKNPDLVFYGGVTSQGGAALKKALGAAGASKLPMLGGDGIADDPQWPVVATNQFAINTIGSIPAPDFSSYASNTAVQTFITQYEAKFNGEKPLPYSLLTYDSTNLVLKVITNLINQGKPINRANVLAGVSSISYTGLTGTISFGPTGDNTGAKVFSIYAIIDTSGNWVFQTQLNA